MRHDINWDEIPEAGEFELPKPGGYEVMICAVQDNESKEYLEICWDFTEGPLAGCNQETFKRLGFWPTRLFRSYKEKALPFFKAFKTAVEESNPGYQFNSRNLQGLVGRIIGIVLGEEEYIKQNGSIGKRLYVYSVRSRNAIQNGEFQVPELKMLPTANPVAAGRGVDVSASDWSDGEILF